MRFLRVGADALLVELAGLDATLALAEAIRRNPIDGTGVPVPAARTLLLPFDPAAITADRVRAAVELRALARQDGAATATGAIVTIPTRYDGEDIGAVAERAGLSVAALITAHTDPEYAAAFTGFAPGFAYLSGGDQRLAQPRLATPRPRIPAGAVAIAGGFSGVYPRSSPGGWNLIGRTELAMWDLDRDPPALLTPGARVRFVDEAAPRVVAGATGRSAARTERPPVEDAPAAGATETDAEAEEGAEAGARDARPRLAVEAVGAIALLQDLGRPGMAGLGVSASGAADRPALRAANRIVGNAPGAAAIEAAGGGITVRAEGTVLVAVTGADCTLTVERASGRDEEVLLGRPLLLGNGDVLRLGAPRTGVRSYLAVRGGVGGDTVLGSRSSDTLSGLGPRPLRSGDAVEIADGARTTAAVLPDGEMLPATPAPGDTVTLDATLGPREDWFTGEALALLGTGLWRVGPHSNRVGLRLAGQPLDRVGTGELPSEGTLPGAIQVPPDGQPVIFLADHPVTGGYPVIARLSAAAIAVAAQLPAGAGVRFRIAREPGAWPEPNPHEQEHS